MSKAVRYLLIVEIINYMVMWYCAAYDNKFDTSKCPIFFCSSVKIIQNSTSVTSTMEDLWIETFNFAIKVVVHKLAQ